MTLSLLVLTSCTLDLVIVEDDQPAHPDAACSPDASTSPDACDLAWPSTVSVVDPECRSRCEVAAPTPLPTACRVELPAAGLVTCPADLVAIREGVVGCCLQEGARVAWLECAP